MERVEVGYVAKAHGVRGELRIRLHNSDSEVLAQVDEIYLGEDTYVLKQAKPAAGGWIVTLVGVTGRDQAEALRGQTLFVRRDAIELEEGEFLLIDLVGCAVVLQDGTAWGEVVQIVVGPQDRMIVVDGEIERELPLVPEFILEVDLELGRITVEPPEELPESRVRGR